MRLLLSAVTALVVAMGLLAAPASATEAPGPPPPAGTHSEPHPDGPSTSNQYLPGTTGAGAGVSAGHTVRGIHPDTGGTVTVTNSQAHGTLTLTPFVMGTVTSSTGGTVQGFFYVRTHGSSTWNLANGTEVDGASGSMITWTFTDQMGTAGGQYDWQMQGCQSGSCSALTTIALFTIDPMVSSGQPGYLSFYDQQLSSSSSLHVNYATGNLAVDSTDLSIGGINGTNLNFARTYNSITDLSLIRSDFGEHWSNTLADLGLGTGLYNQEWIIGPTGYLAGFLHPGTTWVPTSGLDADLSYSGSTYTMTVHHKADGFAAGDQVTFTSGGLVTSVKDKHGNTITIGYNPSVAGQVQTITDTQGRTLTLSNYNANGQAQTVTDSTGRVLTYGYNGSSDLVSFADAGVHAGISGDAATQYAYDSNHHLTQITDPAGKITTISYVGSSAQVASITAGYGTPQATTTQFAYYPAGDSHCTAQPSFGCTTVARDRVNATPNSGAASYELATYYVDNSARVRFVYDPFGNKQATTWDVNSNVLTVADKMTSANVTTATYDSAGLNNPQTVADPTGMTNTLAYTGSGHPYQPDSQTLPNNAASPSSTQAAYTYAAAGGSASYGDVISVTQGATTQQLTYQGDGSVTCGAKPGQVCTTTNGKGGVTSFAYDSSGNLTTVTPPSPLGVIHYTPDSLGRDTSIQDGKSQTTTVHYDALDRVTEVDYPAAAKTIKYTYDGDGNTTSEQVTTTGTVTYSFTYDALNRLTTKTQPANNASVSSDTYTYDLLGNLTQLQESGGTYPHTLSFTETYTYDNLNIATSVAATAQDPNGDSGTTATMTLGHDADGRRTSIAIGSGETRGTVYDKAGREVQTSATKVSGSVTLQSLTYCYVNPVADCPTTPAGAPLTGGIETALKQRTTDGVASLTTGYTYDGLSRLLTANQTAGGTDARSYGYDADGNRTSQTINGTNNTFTYNTADQATSSGYTFDADGNGTATPSLSTLVYNSFNQTTSITKSGTPVSYTYAGGGQDTRTSAAGTDAALSGLGTDVEATGSSTLTYHFYVRDNAGNLLAIIEPDTGGYEHTYYPIQDGQGSIVALTNGSGTITDTATYDPYGQLLTRTGTDYNPFGYTASYTDTTGLIHNSARYYDPTNGRFTQQDPAGQGPNLYIYAGDNPVNNSDPAGLNLVDDVLGTVSTVSGIAGTVLDATGVGAPAGLALNALSATTGVAQAAYDCGTGQSSCGESAVLAGVGVATFGLGAGLGSSAGIGPDIAGVTTSAVGAASGYYCDAAGC